MILRRTGNIFDSDAEALVNTVNTVGVMGKGIALQFKKAYPENFKAYKQLCDAKKFRQGQMFVYHTNTICNPKYIINFPTKRHWRGNSKIEDIKSGLEALVEEIKKLGISSIGIPPLGCGRYQV
jgi:O-acetyl-ADP-ribose deacetylase (regulator of RNase III)